jgi:hypothetical protein
LEIYKAYDHVSRLFLTQLMLEMSFGVMISRLSFMLGLGVVSHVMLNGGVTKPILLTNVMQTCQVMISRMPSLQCMSFASASMPHGKKEIALQEAIIEDPSMRGRACT